MTRSKAWIRVLGYGPNMKKLEEEFNRIKVNNFSLNFTYPTEEERNKMKLVNRDMSQAERKNKEKKRKDLRKAINIDDEVLKELVAELSEEDKEKLKKSLE
ncbi:hypothetical protein [Crocosphaera watsonii]|nr:hypothetical protein [Crocosphaera watsonii]